MPRSPPLLLLLFLITHLPSFSYNATRSFHLAEGFVFPRYINNQNRLHVSREAMASTTCRNAFLEAISEACSSSLQRPVKLEPASGGGYAGGGGAQTSAVVDVTTGNKYFVKSCRTNKQMLRAEYLGVKEMADTHTIQVPTPVAYGDTNDGSAFVVFEYLDMGAPSSPELSREMGRQLAKMHRHHGTRNMFGFHVNNTIGATPQPNLPWMDDWAEFWDQHRLGHMLKLTGDCGGMSPKDVDALRVKTKALLSHHKPSPSLLHGDLWGGNKGFARLKGGAEGEVITCPVIFDPATYYGDREADLAMTELFGGFTNDFYEGYEEEWPIPQGYEQRKVVYNLYHV